MCLTVNTNTIKQVAEEDIKIFKVLKKINEERYNSIYYALYRDSFKYTLGKKQRKIKLERRFINHFSYYTDKKVLEDAVFRGYHSYATLKGAKNEKRKWGTGFNVTYIIMEGIIPKGSTYFVGRFRAHKSYASSSIKILKERK